MRTALRRITMTARYYERTSGPARWSRRIALFAGQLLLIGILSHRLGSISTPPAMYVVGLSLSLAVASLLLSAFSLAGIWRQGLKGGGYAMAGAAISLLVLAGPLLYVPAILAKPKINDVVTDITSPPAFEVLASQRPDDANPLVYPGQRFATQQRRAYPKIRTMVLERSSSESFDLVHEAIERLGWDIVSSARPEEGGTGRIEAVAKTLIMGFADDVVVRVAPGQGESEIDVRSASRYGQHDFGTNARRIASLFAEVKAGLEQGEKTALELALARRAREAREIEKRRRAKARKEREKARLEEEARQRALLEEERERQIEQLRAIREAELQNQSQSPDGLPPGLNPFPATAPDEPKPRVQRRGGRTIRDVGRFFQRFGE